MSLRRSDGIVYQGKDPDVMSLDRIDASKGYTKDNTRLVVWAVNMALSTWGTEHYLQLCADVIKNQKG